MAGKCRLFVSGKRISTAVFLHTNIWTDNLTGREMVVLIYAYTRETPLLRERLKNETDALKNEHPDELIIEKAPSGRRRGKYDAFRKLFDRLRPGDTLIIPSIDRVSHSADDFSGLVAGLTNRGVTLQVLNLGIFNNTEEGLVLRKAVAAFAEFEKSMIVERTRERKAKAREDITFREGRPKKYTRKEITEAIRMLDEGKSYKRVSSITGISVSTLTRARNAEKARKAGDYSMSDAEIREYEAAVAESEQMTLGDILSM